MQRVLAKSLFFLENVSRHKALFLLLLRSDDFITSDELADKLSVTSRTIKSDIKSISRNLEETVTGIRIDAKRSRGVRVVFNSEALKNATKEYFKIYQVNNISTDFEKRVTYIVRRLLSARQPVRVENLQEELYVNTSNYIQQEMQAVRGLLKKYDLSLHMIPKYGFRVQGDYFNKLLCIVKMYHYFSDTEVQEFDVAPFFQLFILQFGTREQIRTIICQCLSATRIVFSDIALEKFMMFYILLCNKHITESYKSRAIQMMDFDYRITDEYGLILAIDKKMKENFSQYESGNPVLIEFMTYMAVMNTDLYRFKDCTEAKYGSLIPLSREICGLVISEFESLFKVQMTSETVKKDLLKVMIPISMKMKLGISDDLDLFFSNQQSNKPIITGFIDMISSVLKEFFRYEVSAREKNLILNVLYEFINGIELSHKKLKIALIAINGRLSTQQLKFCMRKGYASFIEKIDTKVLYELERQSDWDYDYYFCPAYGKNMDIPYRPIYFFEEGITEEEYERKLDMIFVSAYNYDGLLPSLHYIQIEDIYKIQAFPIQRYLSKSAVYMDTLIGKNHGIALYVCFDSSIESLDVFYFDNEGMDINGITQYVCMNLNVQGNSQKFKMILDFISKLADKPERLNQYCKEQETSISRFFQRF
jgi:lichenan operon transcriptional antiterminator